MLDIKKISHIVNHSDNHLMLGECPSMVAAYLAGQHLKQKKQSVIMLLSSYEQIILYESHFTFLYPDIAVVIFPAWNCLPYDRMGASPQIVSKRIQALKLIYEYEEEKKPYIFLTTIAASLQRIRHPSIIKKSSVTAKPRKKVQIDQLARFLTDNGYLRVPTVREAGEFAVRGGIVDIFPSGQEMPVRLDFFGDMIDKIKVFDVFTQISHGTLETFEISPVSEIIPNKKTLQHFISEYRILCGGQINRDDSFYHKISNSAGYVQGMEAYLPLFDNHLVTIFDVISEPIIYADTQIEQVKQEFLSDVEDYYQNRKQITPVVEPHTLYLTEHRFGDAIQPLRKRYYTYHSLPDADNRNSVVNMGFKYDNSFIVARKSFDVSLFDETIKIMRHAIERNQQIFLSASSEGAIERIITSLSEHGLNNIIRVMGFDESYVKLQQTVSCFISDMKHGFASDKVFFITEQDIFGEKARTRNRKNKKADKFLIESAGLSVGDYVVHIDHGVGQYRGLIAVTVNNIVHDCIYLEYAGGDKLYLPVENLDLITRYGGDASGATLDKLGSASWQSRKAKLRGKILDIADELIKVAAERLLKKADIITPNHMLYEEFKARFPFEETQDQLDAIEAVEEDLSSGRPTDRLICGDVGFGKTEVAMRAAFIAASQGIQTALIVPTTLLVRQHYKNFVARYKDFNIKIGRLSRMVPLAESKQTKHDLETGECKIVIATHALLTGKIKFHNLGLLIIDEEQHFGVTHKEKLKELKSNIHVLTLTATPIPRTLQLSMTGVRDLSLITTPPIDRLAIRTYVSEFDKAMIREALLREKYRGGQVFIVVPRITDIDDISSFLSEFVPELSFISANGQMSPVLLDDVMNDFYDGKYDVLVATTIIESGIDIPTANTMIIWRADMFGLAQLYQIRGRIGRSKHRAYAYLTYKPKTILTEPAEKRLKILESLDKLGAGFTLASHDMDIRGTGNLLGTEQSGHIREVGFELYQHMLEQAIATLKSGEKTVNIGTENLSPHISLGISAIIPETYIADLDVRMGLYRRLSMLNNKEEVENFSEEIIDRFGKMPEEVKNLLLIVELKNACKQAHVSKLDVGDKGMVLKFHNDTYPEPQKLLEFVDIQRGKAKIKPDNKLAIIADMLSLKDKYLVSLKILAFLRID